MLLLLQGSIGSRDGGVSSQQPPCGESARNRYRVMTPGRHVSAICGSVRRLALEGRGDLTNRAGFAALVLYVIGADDDAFART